MGTWLSAGSGPVDFVSTSPPEYRMSLIAGRLNQWVTVQVPTEFQDSSGEITLGWNPLESGNDSFPTSFPANFEPLSVRELLASQAIHSNVVARVTMRYDARWDPRMRILFRGKVYDVAGVLPDKVSGLEYVTLPVSTGLSDEGGT
jgi:head-tail adaptor